MSDIAARRALRMELRVQGRTEVSHEAVPADRPEGSRKLPRARATISWRALAAVADLRARGDKRLQRHGLGLMLAAVAALMIAEPAWASASPRAVTWGANALGGLGNGTTTKSNVPVAVSGLGEVAALSGGNEDGLALLDNGTVMDWGWNSWGELGDGIAGGPEICDGSACSKTPVVVSGLSGVTAVSAGNDHDLALLGNGTVMAWGFNRYGQLGNGTTEDSNVPVPVLGLEDVTAIAAGGDHSLALLGNGTVMAWGSVQGPDTCFDGASCSTTPEPVSGLEGVTAISAGRTQSMALLSDGTVVAWGSNSFGQLGNGTTVSSEEPSKVSGLKDVTAISAGSEHSLALLSNGTVMAWGQNEYGQLGNGELGPETCYEGYHCATTPVAVSGLSGVTAIAAGYEDSVALLGDGTARAWGLNNSGTLGDGTVNGSDVPVVVDLTHISSIAAGTGINLAIAPPPSPPEFGRCVRAGNRLSGAYATSACDSTPTGGGYDWIPGVLRTGFTTTGGKTTLETTGKTKVTCTGERSNGHYEGTKEVNGVIITLTGCEFSTKKCSSAGVAEGEVVSNTLEGALGWETKTSELTTSKVALDLIPVEKTGLVAAFTCGTTPIDVRGSIIVPVTKDKMLAVANLAYVASKGKQKPERFEGEAADVLEASFSGGSFAQLGLTVKAKQTSEEEVEINAFV
jgi:alpha-tubulin suppressor-like RCC1 family protein